MRKRLLMLLLLLCLLACPCARGEEEVSFGQLISFREAGLSVTIPTEFEYIGDLDGYMGYRSGESALMLGLTAQNDMDAYAAGLAETGLAFQQETAQSGGGLQVEIFFTEHSNYTAFIIAKETGNEKNLIVEIVVMRNDESLDQSGLIRDLAGRIRSLAGTQAKDTDPASWNRYALFTDIGLGLKLPEDMAAQRKDSDGYVFFTDGVCSIAATLFRCTIGELSVMNGFTSRDYEIYQSNAYNLWEFRPVDHSGGFSDYLAFPGKDGTWMLLCVWGTDGTDAQTILQYIEILYASAWTL